MKYIADLHIHSPYSRATSKASSLQGLFAWALAKGIHVVGAGDFTHPTWYGQLKTHLVEAEPGFFKLKDERVPPALEGLAPESAPVRFALTTEISSIYKKLGKVRKVHSIIMAPDFKTVEKLNAKLAGIGNIESDGRPILGLDPKNLLEILLEVSDGGFLVPAHIWTPWFSLFGSKSGFDSIVECFEDLTSHIFALETGLSSDPDMNRRISALDRFTLISNSDCHSPSKLGREANRFDCGFDFFSMRQALENPQENGFLGTIEFFPEEGKYHFDGHRSCGVRLDPDGSALVNDLCPSCGRPLTIGVMRRVLELADREKPVYPKNSPRFQSIVPLQELLGEIIGQGSETKSVVCEYVKAINVFGSEFNLLLNAPIEDISRCLSPILAEAIRRIRDNRVICSPGYDGEFGVITVFNKGELSALQGQISLFHGSFKKAKRSEQSTEKKTIDSRTKAQTVDAAQEVKRLNPEQEQAIHAASQRVLVTAGPGTGKTFTLVSRLVHSLKQATEPASHFCAITFTNKAAREIRERLLQEVGVMANDVFIGTFHQFCLRWMRQERPDLIVVGEETRRLLLKKLFPAMNRTILSALNQEIVDFFHSVTSTASPAEPSESVQRYLSDLTIKHGIDIEAIIPYFVRQLSDNPSLRGQVCESTRFLLIDEFQDLNSVQYELVCQLAHDGQTFAIGDPNQAIYGFRGSDSRYFHQFITDFEVVLKRLTLNFRSASSIIEAAQAVIRHNSLNAELALTPTRQVQGVIERYQAATPEAEAAFILQRIESLTGGLSHDAIHSRRLRLTDKTLSFKDIAVLYRMSFQAAPIALALEKRGIPFQTAGGEPFYMASDVRPLYDWIRAAEDLGAIEHINVLRHVKGIGDSTVKRIENEAPLKFLNFWEIVDKIAFTGNAAKRLAETRDNLALFSQQAVAEGVATAFTVATRFLEIDPETPNVQRLCALAGVFGNNLVEFSNHLAQNAAEAVYDDRAEAVALMTVHAAKGLEFPVVFIVGLEEGLFPCLFTAYSKDIEEERRLFYVALTRAKDQAILTSAQTRTVFGKTDNRPASRFIAEIPSHLVKEARQQPTREKSAITKQMKLF